jgi:hypothetical protein
MNLWNFNKFQISSKRGETVKKILTIEYDVMTRDVKFNADDFSALEAFGVLEAVKQMIADGWIRYTDEEDSK